MTTRITNYLLSAVCSLGCVAQLSAQNTAFTYQGRLNSDGNAANGVYDFTFQAFDAPVAGNSIGGTMNVNAVGVTNGLFTALLDLGTSPFIGPARWLQIRVSTNGAGSFTALTPRQPFTPSPYAIYAHAAGTVTNGAIANAQLAANSVADANIQNGSITSGKIASGQVVKSLNGLTDAVSLAQGANITINTVSNSLQISAPAGGVNLPFSGSAASSGSVFTITNSGTGPAGAFLGKVGIGTGNPAFPLDVAGTVRITSIGPGAEVLNLSTERSWAFRQLGSGATTALELASVGGGGNKNFIVNTTGSVGIGTTAPTAKLDVRGDIRLGANGQFRATSSQENLRIVRGVITMPQCCVDPVISAGTGFTVLRLGSGIFRVTLTTPFAGEPTISVTCRESVGTGEAFATTQFVSTAAFRVLTYVAETESLADRSFDFIAIGPR